MLQYIPLLINVGWKSVPLKRDKDQRESEGSDELRQWNDGSRRGISPVRLDYYSLLQPFAICRLSRPLLLIHGQPPSPVLF